VHRWRAADEMNESLAHSPLSLSLLCVQFRLFVLPCLAVPGSQTCRGMLPCTLPHHSNRWGAASSRLTKRSSRSRNGSGGRRGGRQRGGSTAVCGIIACIGVGHSLSGQYLLMTLLIHCLCQSASATRVSWQFASFPHRSTCVCSS